VGRDAVAPGRQARYWDRRYRADPTFFGAGPSRFLRWTLAELRGRSVGRRWLELGSGYGRDLANLRTRGFSVRGVDVSRVGTALARRARLPVVALPAHQYLATLAPGSVDVVFSNLFFNMEFSKDDHERLFMEVHRVLAPDGFHAYSVRSVTDAWYGKGTPAGPDMFDLAPHGPVLHFFSRAYAARLRKGRFRCLRSWEGTEGEGEFPITVLYFLEEKR
jgi:SAM-dependent methyltransferase